jgi:glycosyltransferase involved in cell wall biosynthesis
MDIMEPVQQKFDDYNVCVLLPTYNNATTLGQVIEGVAQFTRHIVVVNDGSTDNTAEILAQYDFLQVVGYPQNVGKGWALRQGLQYAAEKGYEYAITIDSDGQHYPEDLPAFLDKLAETPCSVIIGARNMEQASVPGKSSFGHKFSNFWFWVETGIKAPDTQSGYRLYPVQRLRNMRFFTTKYEFEIEVIVRAAWAGIPVTFVPVKVYYAPKETRVSHFRPFRDFSRVSVLNTVLVFITFLYIKPRDFIRGLLKKNLRTHLKEAFARADETEFKKSLSIAFGVFMGIVPIWGFQLAGAIAGAYLLRLNKALVILFANISLPPAIPFILYASYQCGAFWMGEKAGTLSFDSNISLAAIHENAVQYFYGGFTLATLAALGFGMGAFLVMKGKGWWRSPQASR